MLIDVRKPTVILFGATGLKLPHWLRQHAEQWQIQYFTTNLFEQQPLLGLVNHCFGDLLVQISMPERAIVACRREAPRSTRTP
jgi:Transcriptional regulator, AbiEi antitoxin, Type IV TA system